MPSRYNRLPTHMQAPARRYVESKIPPGDFLYHILCNDFTSACDYADCENLGNLLNWALWLKNDIPMSCWGSKEEVHQWLNTQPVVDWKGPVDVPTL